MGRLKTGLQKHGADGAAADKSQGSHSVHDLQQIVKCNTIAEICVQNIPNQFKMFPKPACGACGL